MKTSLVFYYGVLWGLVSGVFLIESTDKIVCLPSYLTHINGDSNHLSLEEIIAGTHTLACCGLFINGLQVGLRGYEFDEEEMHRNIFGSVCNGLKRLCCTIGPQVIVAYTLSIYYQTLLYVMEQENSSFVGLENIPLIGFALGSSGRLIAHACFTHACFNPYRIRNRIRKNVAKMINNIRYHPKKKVMALTYPLLSMAEVDHDALICFEREESSASSDSSWSLLS